MSEYDWGGGEGVLDNWYLRAHRHRAAHYRAAQRYRMYNYFLGIPVIALTSIVGTSVFATLAKSQEGRIQLAVGMLSVAAAVLASLQTFLKLPERSELHRVAGARYAALARDIQVLKAIPADQRENPKQALEDLKSKLDSVGIESPDIPTRIYKRFRRVPIEKFE